MSFQSTRYYQNYNTQDPMLQVRNDLILANSNISIGAQAHEISAAGVQLIAAYNMVNNTIVRTTNVADLQSDTAANILTALRNKLKAQINQNFGDMGTIPNGTKFTFTLLNKCGGSVSIQTNTGVNYDNTNTPQGDNTGATWIMTVVSQVLLGDATDEITICQTDY